jgi:hypothetical protein
MGDVSDLAMLFRSFRLLAPIDFCLSNLLIKSISDEGYIYVFILYYYLIVNFFLFIK